MFTTPFLTSSETYYIENAIHSNPIYGAKPDNTGGGGFFTSYGQHYLVFDCNTDVVLKSVKVYAGDSSNRTIELRNNIGTVLQSKTVYIPSGQSRVTLDFDIPVGTDFELGGPSSPNLYRNNGGTNYPYSVGSIISIKHSSANSNPTGYYYYFYDWEVVEPPCKSERVAVTAFIHYDEPTAIFSLINNDPTIELTDASVHPAFHHWDFGDGNFSNIANTTYTYSANGTYNVKLNVSNGCGSDSTIQQVSISATSVEESTNIDEFTVFPNPTNGKLTLKINIDKTQRIMINIVDMLGQTLWFKEAELQPGIFTTDLDLSKYSKGMYFINIVTNKGNIIKKVIHQ